MDQLRREMLWIQVHSLGCFQVLWDRRYGIYQVEIRLGKGIGGVSGNCQMYNEDLCLSDGHVCDSHGS